MQKNILLIFLLCLSGCVSYGEYRDKFENYYLSKVLEKDYRANAGSVNADVVWIKSDNSYYSKNGYSLWLRTMVHYANDSDALRSHQLAKLNFKQLSSTRILNNIINISYDSQFDCPDTVMDAWRKFLQDIDISGIFKQFQLQYHVNVFFVSGQSFHNFHRISPDELLLNFYFYLPSDCKQVKQADWSAARFSTITHEITHIEQIWIHDGYRDLFPLPQNLSRRRTDPLKLLGEYIAYKVSFCTEALIVASVIPEDEPLLMVEITVEEGFLKEYNFENLGQYLLEHASFEGTSFTKSRFYSDLGRELVFLWLEQYADSEGFIYNNSTSKGSFLKECKNVLSKPALLDSALEIEAIMTH
ncbi:hypothetical protein Q3O60_12510 [Alkalimonas collagenimarina]|uniref:Lipoprotein n=1 Tax=Alkalimonas collagenimarina TaxID=400390 RepID=A0ABT9H120_9GAMM|nr:hypothetical protein [Alkalimonas collagenimarina]MDP4537016.1 hypothetical protein [Alkalimonas collagenimarina]